MQPIQQTCIPRQDILGGTFNPEILTASLHQVLKAYRGEDSTSHGLYTQAEPFFREATYPTDGMRAVLDAALGRLAGDSSLPAILRLETAFGGGKTHTLIALTHLAFRGQELAEVAVQVVDPERLPPAGSIDVVGISGEVVAVHRQHGADLIAYTLWAEIARQIGGRELLEQLGPAVNSWATADEAFLDQLFQGRRVLIMLDELALYAARLAAFRPDGPELLAAALMTLLGYARTHRRLAIVITLASQADAFAGQTQRLSQLLAQVRGGDLPPAEIQSIADQATHDALSVISRDASAVTPVQSGELSHVLARRLFERIDPQAASETADAYMALYRRAAGSLPDDAQREDYCHTLRTHYPFHPRFIRFLTQKLAQVDNFQSTRGVLRVLALAVRRLWETGVRMPMIHTCHLDLGAERIVEEVMGRTGNLDLRPALEADIGSIGSAELSTGMSVAEMLDRRNPHPARLPLYGWTWKTVFLHSLVGRAEGLGSNRFGLLRQDALLEIAQPELPPVQVDKALDAISDEAYYLRERDGRFYAHTDPTLNRILETIRSGIGPGQIQQELAARARQIVNPRTAGSFQVVADVALPEHIPDQRDRLVLAIVDPLADRIDAEAMVTSAGDNRPRINQNHVFLLVPETVKLRTETWDETRVQQVRERLNRLQDLAGRVLAMQRLRHHPEHYGVAPRALADDDYVQQEKSRGNDLSTLVAQTYTAVWYSGGAGQLVRGAIHSGGGEGGVAVIEELQRVLREAGELITADYALKREGLMALGKLCFELGATPRLGQIREAFAQRRSWPVLESPAVLEQFVRAGVEQGQWCLFRMDDPTSTKPEHFHSRETGLPLDLDLSRADWQLISVTGARQRGWGDDKPDPTKVEQWLQEAIRLEHEAPFEALRQQIVRQHGEVPETELLAAAERLVQRGKLMAFRTPGDTPEQCPDDLIDSTGVVFQHLQPAHRLITPAEVATRGWIGAETSERYARLVLDDDAFRQRLLEQLRRIGTLYNRGGKTTIRTLELDNLRLPGNARLRLILDDAPPETMKQLGELFEVLAGLVDADEQTSALLEIDDPEHDCPFLQAVKPDAESR